MILIVDDEQVHLDQARAALEADGHAVVAFLDAEQALERAGLEEPELIVSDVRMPGLDGPSLKRAYTRRHPGRATPFVFLTAMAEAGDVVAGLDCGADDYVIKGTAPEVLRARVRAVLRRRGPATVPLFRGDLGRMPFVKVLQFCEQQGLTGQVDFEGPGLAVSLAFKAGRLLEVADDELGRLCDLAEGVFVVRAQPISFEALQAAEAPAPPRAVAGGGPEGGRPLGRLSGVRAGGRLFQVQTEAVEYPTPHVLSLVMLDGSSVFKRSGPIPAQADRSLAEALIQEQHAAVEQEVRERLETLVRERAGQAEDSMATYYRLFEEGLDSYRRGEHARALALWREARAKNPDDRALEVNIRVAENKLAEG